MKLLSFGEIIWDDYGNGERALGGAPLNFAAYAALFGEEVWLASAVGEDEAGREALSEIAAQGVKTDFIAVTDGGATGEFKIRLDGSGVPTYFFPPVAAYDFIALSEPLPVSFDAVAFGTLALRGESNKRTLEELLTRHRFPERYTDVNLRSPYFSRESIEFCLSHATVAKISEEELPDVTKALYGRPMSAEKFATAIEKRFPEIRLLLLTCGEKGTVGYDFEKGRRYEQKACPAKVLSTVGAGDSFGAAFFCLYKKTGDVAFSLDAAARLSAYVVSCRETVPPGAGEVIRRFLAEAEGKRRNG